MKTKILIFICTSFALCGCARRPFFVTPKANPIIMDSGSVALSSDGKALQGTGRILFDQPLFGLHSKELYFVKADFLNSDSSLTLHSHLSDFIKQDGIQVILKRKANNLILAVSAPNQRIQTLSNVTDYFLQNQRASLYIKVENGTKNFADIAVWDFYINPKGNLKHPAPGLSQENRLPFSIEPFFYSKGRGILWGVQLNNARLIEIFRKSPNNL